MSMKKISEYFYIYQPSSDQSFLKNQSNENIKVQAFVVGNSGCGKTSFINYICDKNYETGISRGSVTKSCTMSEIQSNEGHIRIRDTPGLDTPQFKINKQKMGFDLCQVAIISSKMDNRFEDNTLFQIKMHLKKFSKLNLMTLVLISHLDIVASDQLEKVMNSLEQSIKKTSLNHVPFIIWSFQNRSTSQQSKIKEIFKQKIRNPQRKIQDDPAHHSQQIQVSFQVQEQPQQTFCGNICQKISKCLTCPGFMKFFQRNN